MLRGKARIRQHQQSSSTLDRSETGVDSVDFDVVNAIGNDTESESRSQHSHRSVNDSVAKVSAQNRGTLVGDINSNKYELSSEHSA